jgi:carboxypeptidase family protein
VAHHPLESSWNRPFATVALGILLVPVMPAAGQGQDASIIGQVADDSAAVLPGVTVTATSPALQVRQVIAVTNERGEYRLPPLSIGTYAVQYELQGFDSRWME